MYWQSEKEFWEKAGPQETAYYQSQGCTKTGPETWECPLGTPDWVPRNPDGTIHPVLD